MRPSERRAWTRFLTVARPFFRSEVRWQALGMVVLLGALSLAVNGLNVGNSYVGRDFMTAIERRQSERFWSLALLYAAVFAVSTVVAVFYRYTEERFGLLWRRWLTRHIIDRWLADYAYYRLRGRADIDNPDQRIAEDLRTFTTTTLSLALMATNATVTIVAFAGVLWSITPWLLTVAVAYPIGGSLITILLGRRLVGLNNLQLKKEADFRYELVHTREYAEAIALLGGEDRERARLSRALRHVVENFKAIITVNRNLGFFTVGYNYLIQLIPVVIVAPRYVRGEVEFGVVTQAAMAFSHILGAFSLIIVQFQNISSYAAVVNRISSLWQALGEAAVPAAPAVEVVWNSPRVAYERLTLRTPQEGRALVSDLSMEVPRGRRVLVRGPNGAGKSALLRATAGIWDAGEGRILRPPREWLMFLPERPYASLGCLRDQVLYGARRRKVTDDELRDILTRVGLGPALERVGGLDAQRDWANTLSAGEQQMLAIGRLILADPPYAFLDHAVSAVGPERQRDLYRVLSETGITYVSVGDDAGMPEYHNAILEIREDAGWTVKPSPNGHGNA